MKNFLSSRLGRAEYFKFIVAFSFISSAVSMFVTILFSRNEYRSIPSSFYVLFLVIFFLGFFILTKKRLYDLNLGIIWSFIIVIMIFVINVFVAFATMGYGVILSFPITTGWLFVIRGTRGPNRFGDDPTLLANISANSVPSQISS